jgi:ATP synthase I subunit
VLENLPADTLPRLLGRITIAAVIVGAIGFGVAVLLGTPIGAVGLVVGVALSIGNLRLLARQVSHAQVDGEASTKKLRRQLGGRTIVRLGVLTAIVLVALAISTPLGVGIVAGLVLYQVVFVANVFRVVVAQGGLH